MSVSAELRISRVARADAAKPMRHALAAFLAAQEVDSEQSEDILTAVGEALANAVEHAYANTAPSDVRLEARVEDDTLIVDVNDRGVFIEREARPNRGFGLRIVRAIARAVSVETDGGTTVHMLFDIFRSAKDRQSQPA